MSKDLTDAKRRAIQKYDASNTKQIHLKLNIKTDADILAQLEKQASVQGYIKDLIRDDLQHYKVIENANKQAEKARMEIGKISF